MMDDEKVPALMGMLFGEAAGRAWRGAAERLRRWATAFDEWQAEQRAKMHANTIRLEVLAWQRLLGERKKMPWELERADFEEHMAWMQAQGYAPSTITSAIAAFQNFYRWRGAHGVEAESEGQSAAEPDFNPAAGIKRPGTRNYKGKPLLSETEIEALLNTLSKDTSPLGLRDRALILARLRLGAPLRQLQRLVWGMIEQDAEGAWVRWRAEAERRRLPEEVWGAILEYLTASGRLEGMQAGKYIFAPLVNPGFPEKNRQAQGWREGQYLSPNELTLAVKIYGRLAGIAEEKLTMQALRRTAIRLHLRQGSSREEMKVFLDSQDKAWMGTNRLSGLADLPEEAELQPGEGETPARGESPLQQGPKHGFYAREQPMEEVQAVMAEGILGLQEELKGLRALGRGLLELEGQAKSRRERALLMDAYSKTAYRLGEVKAAMERLEKEEEGEEEDAEPWTERLLSAMKEVSDEFGLGLDVEQTRAEALGGEGRLDEEIASARYVLRRIIQQAQEAQDGGEYAHLAEIYGMGCTRLARMLKRQGSQRGRLERYLRKLADQALREVVEELGIRI